MNKTDLKMIPKFLLMVILSSFLLIAQTGCERSNTSTEVVGFPNSFADLAQKVKPAVVNVRTTSIVTVPGNPFFGPEEQGPFGELFRKFFGNIPGQKMKQQSLGSGFIIDKEGFIITNYHVVDNATDIRVKLADGREFTAKVIGRDEKTDLALIKITSMFQNLPVLPLGNSDNIRVGDWVIAVGNPFGLGQTVTQGIISATGRVIGAGPYDDFLQTDAPINPGNSGGPLINLKGEVVGINTAIVSGGQGIGFAIPSNLTKSVIEQLRTKGKVVRGWLGVAIQTVTPEMAKTFGLKEAQGALVSEVTAGGPAEKGGIKQGDIIVSFDGKTVKTATDLPLLVAETPVGKTVNVTVFRGGKEMSAKVTIQELTEERAAGQLQAPAETYGVRVNNITPEIRAKLGIKDKTGVVVVSVDPGSIADDAGIQPGDIIKGVNHRPIRNVNDFQASIGTAGKGQPVLLLVKRGKQAFYVVLETAE